MNNHTEYAGLLDHYDAFYMMTRTAAMLGTKNSEPYNRDASALIDFIGKAYGWPQNRIQSALSLILGEMMRVGLTADYLALASTELLDDSAKENMILYEIKGRAIEEANRSEIMGPTSGQRVGFEIRNSMGYGSFHHAYEPRLRFAQIKKSADNGDMMAMIQEALMLILGIGCQNDIVSAQRLLQGLLVWGEKSAAVILGFLWGREGNNEMQAFYKDVFELLNENRFFSEQEEGNDPRDNAEEFCILIAAVQSCIVRGSGRKEVDMLFADLISREDMELDEKLELIRKYKDGSWLNHLIQFKGKQPIGFTSYR